MVIFRFIYQKEHGMNRSLRALFQRMLVCTSVIILRMVAKATATNNTVV